MKIRNIFFIALSSLVVGSISAPAQVTNAKDETFLSL